MSRRDDSVFHVERQILHTAMNRPSSLADMALQPQHFATELHSTMWELIQSLALDAKPLDPVYVSDAAARHGHRNLSELALQIGTAADLYPSSDARYPSEILRKAWRDRETRQIAADLAEEAAAREDGAADRAITRLMELHAEDRSYEHTAMTALQAAMQNAMEARRNGGRLQGVPMGLSELDEALGGAHDSDLIVIGARPAMGKTGLLLGMTTSGARVGPVGLVSGEQPHDQVGLRWMARDSRIGLGRLRAGRFGQADVMAMDDAMERIGALPIRILDKSSPDITEVIRMGRRWKHQYGIRALYVDYLQRLEIQSMARAPKHERIGAITRALKNLARDLRIPVIALAQVSRDADSERPQMKHLADSSEIEKEADQILMLWRDLSNPQAKRAAAEINVVKNRHGNIGTVHCTWVGESTSFVDRSPDDELGEIS